jgi:hypothetical protein
VNDAVDTAKRGGYGITIAHIRPNELDIGKMRYVWFAAMNLFEQAIDNADAVTAFQKFAANRSSNEPSAAGNQYIF